MASFIEEPRILALPFELENSSFFERIPTTLAEYHLQSLLDFATLSSRGRQAQFELLRRLHHPQVVASFERLVRELAGFARTTLPEERTAARFAVDPTRWGSFAQYWVQFAQSDRFEMFQMTTLAAIEELSEHECPGEVITPEHFAEELAKPTLGYA